MSTGKKVKEQKMRVRSKSLRTIGKGNQNPKPKLVPSSPYPSRFYPWSPEVEPWVNRWTFSPPPSPPPPSSHHQIFVSLRYRKRQISNWFDFPGNSSDSYLFLLLLLLFPGVFLSGELSTPVQRTVHRLQTVQ